MTREEFEMLTEEQKFQLVNEIESLKESNKENTNSSILVCKCKPTYEFQSIEFEWPLNLDDEDSQAEMFDKYLTFLGFLQIYAPEQKKETPKSFKTNNQGLATQSQLDYMDKLGINHPSQCSKVLASKLIDEFKKGNGTKELF